MKYLNNQWNRKKSYVLLVVFLLIAYVFCLPSKLFESPTSTVVYSKEGKLLGAKIANDGQWRFPEMDAVPEKFETCLLTFEDAYFYKHFGFNPVSISKALYENIKSGKVVRGGSTLTQQVVRLSRKETDRTVFEKFIELVLATRVEFSYSKEEILKLYTSHAPFGGNVVGLEAASWRYFARSAQDLSWAEAAMLAVLPNAPSLIYPGKNQELLFDKRNRLLAKIHKEGIIDSLTYNLAIIEPIPVKPNAIPRKAPHLVEKLAKEKTGQRLTSTLDYGLQNQVNRIVSNYYNEFKQNEINNLAVLVLDVETRKVLAYVGNSPTTRANQKDVNIIHRPRSTGSVIKPFLYAAMLDAGEILPNTLVFDIPTTIDSYSPKNFDLAYSGAVPASLALSKSLNVPAVKMLKAYGLNRFYNLLQKMELSDIKYGANHYGLPLILGGAESNLWDLCKVYAGLSGTLVHYDKNYAKYYKNEFCQPLLLENEEVDFGELSKEKPLLDAGSIYLTFKSLMDVNRPSGEENWEFFDSSQKIAWKTGTSFGFRDAWSIGATKKYVVGVWVGNADGEGRPGLVGVSAAAPVMFDVFELLPKSTWFEEPHDELREAMVCKQSGQLAKDICTDIDTLLVQELGLYTEPCPYHKLVHLDQDKKFQVNTSCQDLDKIVHESRFVLPPIVAYYYKRRNPFYVSLPLFRADCIGSQQSPMDFVYPEKNSKVYLPKSFSGEVNPLPVKLVHNYYGKKVYWSLDESYLGETQDIHEMSILPEIGKHTITVVDEEGNSSVLRFEVLE